MPVTIQATGKIPKAMQLFGVLMVCVSPVACEAGDIGEGLLLATGGAALWLLGRFFAWWFYG